MDNCGKLELSEIPDFYKAIVDESDTAICVCDPETDEIVFMNKCAEKLWGVNFGETAGQKCYEILMRSKSRCDDCLLIGDKQERCCTSEHNGKILKMNGKIVTLAGRRLHVEYIDDITDEKILERRSKDLTIRLESLVRNVPGCVCLYRCDSKNIIPIVIGKDVDDYDGVYNVISFDGSIESLKYVHPDDTDEVLRQFRSGVENTQKFSISFRCKKPNNEHYSWLKLDANVLVQEDDSKLVFAMYSDISIYKNAEEHLRFALSNIEVSDGILIGTGLFNASKRILVNHDSVSLDEKQEYSGESIEFVVERMANLIPDLKDRGRWLEFHDCDRIIEAFKNGIDKEVFDCMRYSNKGKLFWSRDTMTYHMDPSSGDIVVVGHIYDIDAIKTSEKIIKHVVATEFDFLAIVDCATGKIVNVTNNNEILFPPKSGTLYSEAIEGILETYIVAEDFEEAREALSFEYIKKKLDADGEYTYAASVNKAAGKINRKMWKYTYFDESKTEIFAVRLDITEIYNNGKKKNIALTTALTAARQASVAKTDFLSRMSHEIRTPMNAIIGMAAIAAQSMDDSEKLENCISKIGISARFLLSLINDILDMSRIESGKMLLKSEKIPFNDFINEINSICYVQAEKKNINYECIMDSSVESVYIGDYMKLQQLVINILANSMKFTPENGRVSLFVTEKRHFRNDSVVRFVINDTGCGMSEDFLPHIFESFSQENSGIENAYGGTGLGLTICKNIADLMDGKIDVRSIKNVGSEFTVDVKLGISQDSYAQQPRDIMRGFENLKVLVVDDDVDVCEQAAIILHEMKIEAELVNSGAAAVELINERRSQNKDFDMVLLDWKMPEMDGIETARRIRRIVGAEETIIIITAYDWMGIEKEAQKAGVDYFLSKPMFKSNLISTFEKALGQKCEEKAQPENDSFDFSGKRLLLAEDQPVNVEVARNLLERRGFVIDHAENGLKALEIFSKSEPGYYAAILMDIRMPIMDGLLAASNIRHLSNKDAKTIPIIAMTANAFDDDVEKSHKAGMNAHLAKPIDPQLLYKTLKKFLG